jgi:branched-chain amino acid aminotransferase
MMRVWQDGLLLAPEDAHVAIADRGLLLGDGLFETMAVHNGRVFDLDAHLDRLASGLSVLGFAGAVDIAKLRAGIAHYLASEDAVFSVLRVTVTRGAGPRGLAPPEVPRPIIFMTLAPMPPARQTPLSLHIAAGTRRNEHSPLSRLKALPYLDNVLALSEARAHGGDDALMLNTRGTIACGTIANVFTIRDGCLETPPVGDGALPGTMRALVLSLAKQAGLAPVEKPLELSGLGKADHVFLTNSISRVTEAGQCDGTPLQRRADAALDRLRALIASRFDAA